MYGLINNSPVISVLPSILKTNFYDYLVIKNWDENKKNILNSGYYEIIYENEIGIIARKSVK